MSDEKPIIAVLGGTGDLGSGLVYRWAKAGHSVIIGSRKEEGAIEAMTAMLERVPNGNIQAMENGAAAAAATIVTVTVPFAHQASTLAHIKEAVQHKILIDVTVALKPPKVGRVQLPEEGSAGVIAQNILGENVQVVSAFQNIAAAHLDSDHHVDCDVLVTGDKKAARQVVIDLAADADLKAWHAGPLANSAAIEAMTSVLITLNKQYGIPGAGFVITGTPSKES